MDQAYNLLYEKLSEEDKPKARAWKSRLSKKHGEDDGLTITIHKMQEMLLDKNNTTTAHPETTHTLFRTSPETTHEKAETAPHICRNTTRNKDLQTSYEPSQDEINEVIAAIDSLSEYRVSHSADSGVLIQMPSKKRPNQSRKTEQTPTPAKQWLELLSSLTAPASLMLGLLITALGILLVTLQADIYTTEGIRHALLIAIACELGLVVLAFLKPHTKMMGAMKFIALGLLFVYTLGSQAFGLLSQADLEKSAIVDNSSERKTIQNLMTAAIQAKENASRYGDHAGVRREDANILRYEDQLKALTVNGSESSRVTLIAYEAWGLIALRGFLMILMLIMTHEFRRHMIQQKEVT